MQLTQIANHNIIDLNSTSFILYDLRLSSTKFRFIALSYRFTTLLQYFGVLTNIFKISSISLPEMMIMQ